MQPKSLNNHCNMKRYALNQLKTWKDQPNRKPLILQGAQQVGKTGEIDFLVQQGDCILPVEVKAEDNLQAKSLKWFVENNKGLHGLRFSMSRYREQDWITNYPLYTVEAVM